MRETRARVTFVKPCGEVPVKGVAVPVWCVRDVFPVVPTVDGGSAFEDVNYVEQSGP